ncbi:MAG: DUF917 domain-containing protein [Thermomicrobium sp.]|nr:DUF917 domain-containing protein [Thermomicrobium sp.]MDW7981577.1 DUF917 domain-containing protein [Thermomicrobium sp.]
MAWELETETVEALAIGAGILGTGGGGNPYYGKLFVRRLLREGRRVRIVSPSEVPDHALVVSVGGMGAPTIGIERIHRGDEPLAALRALERYLGQRATHLVPGEIGGANALRPMAIAALADLPVVDGDGMGRAFPELQMETFAIYGIAPTPAALADIEHNLVVFPYLRDAVTLERYARAVTVQMGGAAGFAFPAMSGAELRRVVIPCTVSLAVRLGRAVLSARREHRDPITAALSVTDGQVLFRGKVIDVERRLTAGFARGTVRVAGLEEDRGSELLIEFQNENLIARRDGQVVAVVPDLICLVDLETAEPVTTEVVRYGLRVAVLGIPAPAMLRTPEALAAVGPGAFGYRDVPYRPLPGTYGKGLLVDGRCAPSQ